MLEWFNGTFKGLGSSSRDGGALKERCTPKTFQLTLTPRNYTSNNIKFNMLFDISEQLFPQLSN